MAKKKTKTQSKPVKQATYPVRRVSVDDYMSLRKISGEWLKSVPGAQRRRTMPEWDVWVDKLKRARA